MAANFQLLSRNIPSTS